MKRFNLTLLLLLFALPFVAKSQDQDETLTEKTLEGLPYYECFVDDGQWPKPLLLLLHGYGGGMDSGKEYAAVLAKSGFFVVVPEAYAHKRRPNHDQLNVTQIAYRTANELDTFIDHYAKDERIKPNHNGILGVSMGAIATYTYLAKGTHKVKAAAPLIGNPDYIGSEGVELTRTIRGVTDKGRMATDEEIEKIKAFCKANNPMDRWENMRGVHIIMQNGNKDPLISTKGVEELYRRLTHPREEGVEVILDIYEMEHTLTPSIIEKTVLFLKSHLIGQ